MKTALANFLMLGLCIVFIAAVFYLGVMTSRKQSEDYQKLIEKLQEQKAEQVKEIDSLRTAAYALKDSLQVSHDLTTKEVIKYYEIKPKSNSVPYLDSMFRARFH